MKVLLLSHVADADGVMPVILTDLVFDDYEYRLFEIGEINDYISDGIKKDAFKDFDKIIVTDLCVNDDVAKEIDKSFIKDKIIILDHHQGNIHLNKYNFINVIVEQDGIKESGTSLYYKFLLANYPNPNLIKNSVSSMVSLVRLGDTWDWYRLNIPEARDLGTVLNCYGNDKFIENYKNFLRNNDEFSFTEIEQVLINVENNRRQQYIESFRDKIIFRSLKGKRVGIVIAEAYRSDLGNDLAMYYHDKVDLIMIVNLVRWRVSFRSIESGADVNEFAKQFGGGGHVHAASAAIPLKFKEQLIDLLIKNYE